jgi:hypothetical protein
MSALTWPDLIPATIGDDVSKPISLTLPVRCAACRPVSAPCVLFVSTV